MRYTIKLPQDQQDIVVDALRIYKETIESLCPIDDDNINGNDKVTDVSCFKNLKILYACDHTIIGNMGIKGLDLIELYIDDKN